MNYVKQGLQKNVVNVNYIFALIICKKGIKQVDFNAKTVISMNHNLNL